VSNRGRSVEIRNTRSAHLIDRQGEALQIPSLGTDWGRPACGEHGILAGESCDVHANQILWTWPSGRKISARQASCFSCSTDETTGNGSLPAERQRYVLGPSCPRTALINTGAAVVEHPPYKSFSCLSRSEGLRLLPSQALTV
jgi:hypothetical protein